MHFVVVNWVVYYLSKGTAFETFDDETHTEHTALGIFELSTFCVDMQPEFRVVFFGDYFTRPLFDFGWDGIGGGVVIEDAVVGGSWSCIGVYGDPMGSRLIVFIEIEYCTVSFFLCVWYVAHGDAFTLVCFFEIDGMYAEKVEAWISFCVLCHHGFDVHIGQPFAIVDAPYDWTFWYESVVSFWYGPFSLIGTERGVQQCDDVLFFGSVFEGDVCVCR